MNLAFFLDYACSYEVFFLWSAHTNNKLLYKLHIDILLFLIALQQWTFGIRYFESEIHIHLMAFVFPQILLTTNCKANRLHLYCDFHMDLCNYQFPRLCE